MRAQRSGRRCDASRSSATSTTKRSRAPLCAAGRQYEDLGRSRPSLRHEASIERKWTQPSPSSAKPSSWLPPPRSRNACTPGSPRQPIPSSWTRSAASWFAEAETQAKEKLLEAKEGAVKVRTAAEQEAREYRVQSQQIEKRLLQKEENLDRKGEDLNRRERELTSKEKGLDDIKAQLEDTYRQQEPELQRVANMTRQEARGILMGQVEQELRNEVARKVREAAPAARH